MSERHVVFICDDNYVMPTIVTMRSLHDALGTNTENRYIIHVCSLNLSESNIERVREQLFPRFEVKIDILDSEKYSKKLDKINQNSHVTPTALLKFELANIYSELDEILYLDSDLIIKKDISEIFIYDLNNYLVAAVFEFWKYLVQHYKYSGKEYEGLYFNSGVMRLNLKRFREEKIPEKLWEIKFSSYNDGNTKKFRLMDQDAFNEICAQKCLYLPIKFNCDAKFTVSEPLGLLNQIYHASYKNYQDLYEDVIILHYIGKDEKPWIYKETVKCELWDMNYEKTSFGKEKLKRKKIGKNPIKTVIKIMKSIHYRGFINTFRYVFEKHSFCH